MVLMILSIWALGSLLTFRHTGHSYELHQRSKHLAAGGYPCDFCKCNNCGDYGKYHDVPNKRRRNGYSGCTNYEAKSSVHGGTFGVVLPLTIALWPGILLGYGLIQTQKALGLTTSGSFFAPAPEIKTRAEREQAKLEARKTRLAELDKAIELAEQESERQLARQKALGLPV